MTTLLVHHHKYGDEYYDMSTKEKADEAWKMLFEELDDFEAYSEFGSKFEKELYQKAKSGDLVSIKKLLERRRDYEYEGWSIEKTKN